MDYQQILEKLEAFRDGFSRHTKSQREAPDELLMLYGELEEVINRFAGIDKVEVPSISTNLRPTTFPNFIAARLFSGRTYYSHEAYTQLMKVIGKVRQHSNDPTIPQVEYSVTSLVQVMRRFRECCQYLATPLNEEKDAQDILWIMLRSHFDRLEREETLPTFGVKQYRPDFGVPDLRILIEVKYIGIKTERAKIQEEILADIPGYLSHATNYDSVIVLVYDAAHKLRDAGIFVDDMKSVDGITDVIVVPGFGNTPK